MTSWNPAADLRQGIAALLRGERPAPGPVPERPPTSDLCDLPGAEFLPTGRGEAFCLRRNVEDGLPGDRLQERLAAGVHRLNASKADGVDRGLRPARGVGVEDLLILDLETTGFWGCPIFLVGVLRMEAGRLVTRQILARDYAEEATMLAAAAGLVRPGTVLVTFNGKSYDVPCFSERAALHGVPHDLRNLRHVDILHPARRRWRRTLPDCRLQTLERRVLGWRRTGDVPSALVPEVYHRFVAGGSAENLLPVLHHSRVDLLTTAGLFADLATGDPKLLPLPG